MKKIIYIGLFGVAWISASLAYADATRCEECKANCTQAFPNAIQSCISRECMISERGESAPCEN